MRAKAPKLTAVRPEEDLDAKPIHPVYTGGTKTDGYAQSAVSPYEKGKESATRYLAKAKVNFCTNSTSHMSVYGPKV